MGLRVWWIYLPLLPVLMLQDGAIHPVLEVVARQQELPEAAAWGLRGLRVRVGAGAGIMVVRSWKVQG